jgi:hypothetical protein
MTVALLELNTVLYMGDDTLLALPKKAGPKVQKEVERDATQL